MSYFFAGCKSDASLLKNLERSFQNVMPATLRDNARRLEKGRFLLATYGSDRAIEDIIFVNDKTGSWFAILGTPLIRLMTEEDSCRFIEKLFRDSTYVINRELDGCFALMAYDAPADTFHVVTDFNNTTPVYYAKTAHGFCFSSHELPLARALRASIDPVGFSMAIHTGVSWGSRTRFMNIEKLLPCHSAAFRRDGLISSNCYWTPQEEAQWPARFEDVLDRWLSLLRESVGAFYAVSKNKTVICEITAGEDSRLLLSECHASGIPFIAMVDGAVTDVDVRVAAEASRKTGFELIIRSKPDITPEQLVQNAVFISLSTDAYQDFFESCSAFATNAAYPPRNYDHVKFCGAPGGEAFRGSYYLRGKAIFPSSKGHFDHRFFTRMKYLLDFYPGLLNGSDEDFHAAISEHIEGALETVKDFPVGIRIDHLLRVFQTCHSGLIYKNPRYLPFATKSMTRSVYSLPPNFKRGGKLTKACTEALYPELAVIKTQKGVPTIRKTPARVFLFMPEYISTARSIIRGATGRLLKWTESNKAGYKWSKNAQAIKTLLDEPPYRDWLSSSTAMVTGHLYNKGILDSLLSSARFNTSRYVPILGRVISQELACRWVYGEGPRDSGGPG